jgi:mercuric ion binding protein
MRSLALSLALLIAVPAVFAAERTVTLAVENMTCAACPVVVKRSLTRVSGVKTVEVSLERKRAVVAFDDARTSVTSLTDATAKAGFPSSLVER